MKSSLPRTLRWRLSLLWALEWGITGCVLTYLPVYLSSSGFSERELGWLMAVSAVGLWVAPLVVGQICDRWMATDRYLIIAHLAGGLTLLGIPIVVDAYQPGEPGRFPMVLLLFGVYACAYIPTVPLASSLTFRHLEDPDSQFGGIRVWGTVGWVVAGLVLSCWLGSATLYHWLSKMTSQSGWGSGLLEHVRSAVLWIGGPSHSDSFRMAAVLSFLLCGFCWWLPSTPPVPSERTDLAPVAVLRLFKNRGFALLIGVSFLLAVVVPFYSLAVPQLLTSAGVSDEWVPAVMTVGQISEFPSLFLLYQCTQRWGLKGTFAAGIVAWLLRYSLFAATHSIPWILVGISLHGVCHVFVIIVLQIYIDRRCPADLRASMQNLFAFVTLGIAMPVGFVLSGWLAHICRLTAGSAGNYSLFFAAPAVLLVFILPVYWRYFEVEEASWTDET